MMDFGGYTRFPERGFSLEQNRVPEWARQEQLEKAVSLREIWKYEGTSAEKRFTFVNALRRTTKRIARFHNENLADFSSTFSPFRKVMPCRTHTRKAL